MGRARNVCAAELRLAELESRRPQEALEVGWLSRYERSLPVVNDYDQLLAGEVRR